MKVACGANVSLKEWNKNGWTYHAKGETPYISYAGTTLSLYDRDMGTAVTFVSSNDDLVRFHQPELQIVKSGYRTVLRYDRPGK